MKSHNIKDLLEERRMEVSENSWEKLAKQLDTQHYKKQRNNLYPYAACIAVLFGIIIYMLLNTNPKSSQTIVATEKNSHTSDEIETPDYNFKKDEISAEIMKESAVAKETSSSEISEKNPQKASEQQPLKSVQQEEIIIAFEKEVQKTKPFIEIDTISNSDKSIVSMQEEETQKLREELKASIDALSTTEKIAISDAEIDALLKDAQQSLRELDGATSVETTNFATADDLLMEVELELEKSFKEKVFDLIKNKIKQTRTASVEQ